MYAVVQCIVNWLIEQGVIHEAEKEIYEYSTYCICISVIPLIIVAIFSIYLHGIVQYFMLIVPFKILRQYSGGYHAPKAWICMVFSTILLVISVYFVKVIHMDLDYYIIETIACFIIIKNSPIESVNKKLSSNEKVVYHRKVIICMISFVSIQMVAIWIHWNTLENAIAISFLLVAISQLPCMFSIKKQNISMLGDDYL